MAVEQLLFYDAAKLPASAEVQAKAQSLGYDFAFNGEYDLRTHTGFLPIKVDGAGTGFEYYFVPVSEVGELPEGVDPTWTHASLSATGGDFRELVAALIFFRSLAELTGGAYWYPGEALTAPDRTLTDLDGWIADNRKEVQKIIEREARQAQRAAERAQQAEGQPQAAPPPTKPRSWLARLFGKED